MLSVGFRVDVSVQIGAGHLQRCMTLADGLRAQGDVRTQFICRSLPEHSTASLRARGHRVTLLPAGREQADRGSQYGAWLGTSQAEDAQQTAAAVAPGVLDWCIVDHYALDTRWEAAMRPHAARILAIDDLANRAHACDMLLDQNFYRDLQTRYTGLVPANCRELLGPRYALLREEFAAARSTLRTRDGTVQRVLVFFGAGDPDNWTGVALDALERLGRKDLAVDVVVGALNPHRERLEALCAARPVTRVLVDVANMAQLMCDADLAVGAGGTATWERCCLGLPTIAMVTADNQRQLINDLGERAVLVCPTQLDRADSAAELGALLEAALSSATLLRGMTLRSQELVDGQGTQRVIGAMLGMAVTLREAGRADCDRIYGWRNSPQVRQWSRNQAPIDYPAHCAWYAQMLDDPARVLLIAEHAGQAVGVVRFDIHDTNAEISVYATPDRLSGGWGAAVLHRASDWLQSNHPHVQQIVAEVLAENVASRGAFRRAGYREDRTMFTRSV